MVIFGPNIRKLKKTGDIEGLIVALGNKNSSAKAHVALVGIGEEAVEPLILALGNSDENVRKNAAEALGVIEDARAVEPLIRALQDEELEVRISAANALGEIGDARAVEPLIHALNDEELEVRGIAAAALGRIGDARAVEPLIRALNDEELIVRSFAAMSLGEIGDIRAYSALEKVATDDSEEYVRERAKEALQELQGLRRELEHKKPELHINVVADAGFKVGMWENLHATVKNVGENAAINVVLKLHGQVEGELEKTIPKLQVGESSELALNLKPTDPGSIKVQVELRYENEVGKSFHSEEEAWIEVADKDELKEKQPSTVVIHGDYVQTTADRVVHGSYVEESYRQEMVGGDKVEAGAAKITDSVVQRSEIGEGAKGEEKPFTRCPYCGKELNLPKTPKFCPYCGEQLR